jgi:hypothetical protein
VRTVFPFCVFVKIMKYWCIRCPCLHIAFSPYCVWNSVLLHYWYIFIVTYSSKYYCFHHGLGVFPRMALIFMFYFDLSVV